MKLFTITKIYFKTKNNETMHDLFLYRNNVFKCLKQKEREKKLFELNYSEVMMIS